MKLVTTFALGAMLAPALVNAEVRALDKNRLDKIDATIEAAIAEKVTPGAVLLIGTSKHTLYAKAYGRLSYEPEAPPVQIDTIYDVASLSKSVGCATSIMILADRGMLAVTDTVARHLPEFANEGKEHVTIEQLLLHRSGLAPTNPVSEYEDGPEAAIRNIMNRALRSEPGTHFAYSDLNYIVLGELVRVVARQPLDQFARANVFDLLGMTDTAYNPPPHWRPRIAPTQKRDGEWMIGEVHDPRAYALGGVAGHAGVFSTAPDLARYCQMILNKGQLNGTRVLTAATVEQMTVCHVMDDIDKDGNPIRPGRTYGFDCNTAFSAARGERFDPETTFGHTGYTGTLFWLDPVNDCFFILLTNRVHPDDKADVKELRSTVATLVAEALLGPASESR